MTRKTKALSGASQDAYFRRVLKTYPDLSDDARERIVRQLRSEIAQLRVRSGAREAAEAINVKASDASETQSDFAASEAAQAGPASAPPPVAVLAELAETAQPFDPFAVNVIVVLRTAGKDAALEALNAIADADNLRHLAREQRLSVDEELATPEALSLAIVAAAERRIANRRAAAGR